MLQGIYEYKHEYLQLDPGEEENTKVHNVKQ